MRERETYIDYVTGSRRLKALREGKKLSHQKLAEMTKINKQSLVNYERAGKEDGIEYGTRIDAFGGMSVNSAVALAKAFGVSTDYLLGVSHIRSPDADVQAVCNYTGLDERSVEQLHYHALLSDGNKYSASVLDGINLLAGDKDLGNEILSNVSMYVTRDYSGFHVPDAEDKKLYSHIEVWSGLEYSGEVSLKQMKAGIIVTIQGLLQRLHDKVKEGK